MKKLLRFLDKYGIYILISLCLLLGVLSLLFKNATMDDDLYLWETSMMTEALKRGEWIGNYAVGTHGFLFKLPVALIFLITGSSLAVATIWNVLLACLSLFLFYKLIKTLFKNSHWPFWGTLLLLCSFQFILNLPTYMREFPVFLSVILLLYLFVNKKSFWLSGLSLLLVFDAKEYVFFMIVPGIVLYVLLTRWKGFNFKTVLEYFKTCLKLLLPTIVFILLMIFTTIIPINTYALSIIPGVTKGGIEYQMKHFDVDSATTNRIEKEAPSMQEAIVESDNFFVKTYKTVKSYLGKILYPRTFSFLSIPKVIFFPALFTSIFIFIEYLKKKKEEYICLSFVFWSFILVFILRASFDRYLFPILPLVVIFFLLFLKDLVKNKKLYFITILITSLLAISGLVFEVDYLIIKIILNILIIGFLIFYGFFYKRFGNLKNILILFISLITFSVVGYFYYANGQLHQYILWGHDYDVKEVVTYFHKEEKILFNDPGWDILMKLYRGDNRYDPEWKWELSDWIPRKRFLKMFEKMTSFGMYGKTINSDRKLIIENEIEKIVLIVSTLEEYKFPYQNRLQDYLDCDWVELEQIVELKNKDLYIFTIIKENI